MIPERKDVKEYVGMGVGIMCIDGRARKFKITNVLSIACFSGIKVMGVILDCPKWMIPGKSQFTALGVEYVKPDVLFRTKRLAAENYDRLKIEKCRDELKQLEGDIETAEKKMEYLLAEKNEAMEWLREAETTMASRKWNSAAVTAEFK